MPLRRLLAPIAVFLLGVITCLPTGVHAAGLVKSGDSPDNRISIQEITATYENEGISGTTLIQNGMDSSVAGASIQVTIDQQPDGSATQRVASKILP
ncbi:MAG TPA: hypothetical protein VLA04_06095, partial [Verrucomicrobiae bacterium]|nr:hypothetical protein [Verrucomicrobiae bacterium]